MEIGGPSRAGLSWATLWSRKCLSPALSASAFFSLSSLGSPLQPTRTTLSLTQVLPCPSPPQSPAHSQGVNNGWYFLISYFCQALIWAFHGNPLILTATAGITPTPILQTRLGICQYSHRDSNPGKFFAKFVLLVTWLYNHCASG